MIDGDSARNQAESLCFVEQSESSFATLFAGDRQDRACHYFGEAISRISLLNRPTDFDF